MPRKLKKKGIPPEGFTFTKSEYTRLREHYLRSEYKVVETMLHHIIQQTDCQYWRLRYPLFSLLKAIARKLLLNQYECLVFGYFLSLNKWRADTPTIMKHRYNFPEVVYVNDPTDQPELRSLTLFLYLTCYSVKQYLNEDASIYLQEMVKMHANFVTVNADWINSQQTAELELDPEKLNSLYKKISRPYLRADYSQLVDQILHISPCYGIDKEKAAVSRVTVEVPMIKQEHSQTPIQTLFPSHGQDLLENLGGWGSPESNKDLL